MNYTKKSFQVNAPGTRTYADNWERTFRKPAPALPAPPHGATCCVVDLNGDRCWAPATVDLGDSDVRKFFCDAHGEDRLKQLYG